VESIVEAAEAAGFATGLITTTTIQHATPAAFYSHRADRNWYPLIATDLVGSGIDVVIGGGREYMIPRGSIDEDGGRSRRRDSRNLIEEMKAEGYAYVSNTAGFSAIDPSLTEKLLGLFGYDALQPEYDRQTSGNPEPPLWELVAKSLEILSNNPRGFFLMVEAGQIDWAAHDNDAVNLIGDAIACDKAVGVAAAFAEKNPNTLLIVVPDHGTGGPNLIGFYRSSDPGSRTRSNESVGLNPYTLDENGFPISLGDIPPAVGWSSSKYFLHTDDDGGEHTAEDVTIHATGPGSEKLTGLMNNTDINAVMRAHLGL
jgi:alkaline phosphatase